MIQNAFLCSSESYKYELYLFNGSTLREACWVSGLFGSLLWYKGMLLGDGEYAQISVLFSVHRNNKGISSDVEEQ